MAAEYRSVLTFYLVRSVDNVSRAGRVYLLSRAMVTSVNDTKCAVNLPVKVETDVCKLLKP